MKKVNVIALAILFVWCSWLSLRPEQKASADDGKIAQLTEKVERLERELLKSQQQEAADVKELAEAAQHNSAAIESNSNSIMDLVSAIRKLAGLR